MVILFTIVFGRDRHPADEFHFVLLFKLGEWIGRFVGLPFQILYLLNTISRTHRA